MAAVIACGPGPRSGPAADSPASAASDAGRGERIASSLNVSVGEDVRLALHITNVSPEPVEIQFASGQTHDFAVLDSTGREIWRWSEGRMFTQATHSQSLDSAETLTYEERWTPSSAAGRFTVIGRLVSTNRPVEQRLEFSLP